MAPEIDTENAPTCMYEQINEKQNVEFLKSLLSQSLDELLVVRMDADGQNKIYFSGFKNRFEVIGKLEMLKHQLLKDFFMEAE